LLYHPYVRHLENLLQIEILFILEGREL